jgi:hypothetical protein
MFTLRNCKFQLRAIIMMGIPIFVLSFVPAMRAQGVTYDGCTDVRGIAVASVLNYGLYDVASATLAPTAPLSYFITPAFLLRLDGKPDCSSMHTSAAIMH